eukprot:COSAG06_NODE_46249_length_348_cov_0.879518_1_plen_52_part_10
MREAGVTTTRQRPAHLLVQGDVVERAAADRNLLHEELDAGAHDEERRHDASD